MDNEDPRLSAGPWSAGWPGLPERTREELHAFMGQLQAVVRAEAQTLEAAGVPVDPGSPLDLSLLVQLALLDVHGTPEEVADVLNLVPPYSLSGDGRDLMTLRDGTSEGVERAANTVRRWWRSQHDDDRSAALRDRGGRQTGSRTSRGDSDSLREHLPAVMAPSPPSARPSCSGSGRRTWPVAPGSRWRQPMGKRVGDPPPAPRTLQRAVKEVRQ